MNSNSRNSKTRDRQDHTETGKNKRKVKIRLKYGCGFKNKVPKKTNNSQINLKKGGYSKIKIV